jgi:hypothetical protein
VVALQNRETKLLELKRRLDLAEFNVGLLQAAKEARASVLRPGPAEKRTASIQDGVVLHVEKQH